MSNSLSGLNSAFIHLGEGLEKTFGSKMNGEMPYFKYFTLPIYQTCAEKVGKVAATAITFFAADLVFNQAVPQALSCLSGCVLNPVIPGSVEPYLGLSGACDFTYSAAKSLGWIAVGIPIMYVKYLRG